MLPVRRQSSSYQQVVHVVLAVREGGRLCLGFGNVAQVLRALGVLDLVVAAVDPLESDIGRLRAGNLAKKRAR